MSGYFARNAMAALVMLSLLGWPNLGHAQSTAPDVNVAEDETSFILSNGTVTARVAKRNGDLASLQYKGTETLYAGTGRAGAYWSHDATGGTSTTARITIDPKSNNGDRAEVSLKVVARADVQSDVDLRYSIGRGESGIYFYCAFDHQAEYQAMVMGESRWVAKLADYFDWTGVEDERLMREVPQETIGHLYTFSASFFEHPAYGWASSKRNVGFWLINPSTEYIGGGATKTDFLAHRDTNQIAAPCVVNFWKAAHFGNGNVTLGQGERWSKVIGPMFIYCNSGADPLAMRKDALSQASKESGKWPYEWVKGIDYSQKDQRTTVKGQLVLSDPQNPSAKLSKLLVGLMHPTYPLPTVPARGRGAAADPAAAREVEWQLDAKFYQFWTRGEENGSFSIPHVRPGKYTLRAVSDGVLGEFTEADITVEAGKPVDLGKLTWTPVRRGKQVWEIGVPNRNAREFTYGDKFFDPNAPFIFPKMFPDDVNFTIGKSDPRKDWFYQHIPHAVDDSGRLAGNQGVTGNGRATPYNIRFEMPTAPKGKATLRLAICGTQGRTVEVSVNEKPAGQVNLGPADAVITRRGSEGVWYEREVAFDASLMKQGANILTLTIPAGPINNGVLYDYVRLELDESAAAN